MIKEPLILLGLGIEESNKRAFFVFKKDNQFREIFNDILEKIGLPESIPVEQSEISEIENVLEHYRNVDFDIDLVYTKNQIIMIVRSEVVNLEKLKSLILSNSEMLEN